MQRVPCIIAMWLIAWPTSAQLVIDTAQQMFKKDIPRHPLTKREMKRLRKALPKHVVIFYQFHGEIVTIPPGFPHMVINLAANIKVALDVIRENELHLYALTWKYLSCGPFKDNPPRDYVKWFQHTFELCKAEFLKFNRPS